MLKGLRRLFAKRATRSTDDRDHDAPADRPQRSAADPAIHRGPNIVHRPIPAADLDPDAVKIVERLTRFDHKAYLVGGCVRDLLLERAPKDFDVATSATPRQIKRVFRNCRIIGRRFRLAHIYFQNGKIIEVATFRSSDGGTAADDQDDLLITEDNVFGTPEEDALRRDFTINSLFYDVSDETVLDHADGLHDLKARLVRTIGDPEIRFREDPIRSLRAIKFAARLDFHIEQKTLAALEQTKNEISKAAPPRVLEELNRFCRGGAARRSFELMKQTGLFGIILPELAGGFSDDECWSILIDLLDRMDRDRFPSGGEVRAGAIFAALLSPIVAREVGWLGGALRTDEPPRVMEVRDRIDAVLRPLSLRLRIPRREQEHCRQILGTMFRLVPARQVRRSAKRSILARPSLAESLWILEVFAKRRGGVLAESLATWRDTSTSEPQRVDPVVEDDAAAAGKRRRRRGGRGRGRRRASQEPDANRTEAAASETERATGDGPRPNRPARRPSRWSDDYFFEALPSVPDLKLDDGHERYRSSTESDTTESVTASPAAHGARRDDDSPTPSDRGAEENGGRRRRRRRRRRRGGGGQPPASDREDAGDPAGIGEP